MNLDAWAIRWGVTPAALADLRVKMGLAGQHYMHEKAGESERAVDAVVTLEAARKGITLWRNNVGVLKDINGQPVRYGLANVTRDQNLILKSADRVGIRPVLIGPSHVGLVIGQFICREIKHKDWVWQGDAHELAQQAWAFKVLSLGGDAGFATGEGTL